MKLNINPNGIVAIKNTLQEGREYSHVLGGKTIVSQNFKLPVVHKKTIKLIDWKDLGEKMQIFFNPPYRKVIELDIPSFEYAFDLFQGFDESTGEKYSYLYKVRQQKIKEIMPLLEQYHIDMQYIGGIYRKKKVAVKPENIDVLSFIFGLLAIYGNFQKRETVLLGIKIFIPLFGQYTHYKSFYENIITELYAHGYYITVSEQETNDAMILQLSITDYELLLLFSQWYQSVEKHTEIIKVSERERLLLILSAYITEKDIDTDIDIQKLKLIQKE